VTPLQYRMFYSMFNGTYVPVFVYSMSLCRGVQPLIFGIGLDSRRWIV